MQPVFEAREVRKGFPLRDGGRVEVLRGVSLRATPGESIAVMGRSGAGKSTLLSCLGLRQSFDSGTLMVGGRSIDAVSDRQLSAIRGRFIGFVFQDFRLLGKVRVLDNVVAGGVIGGMGHGAATRRGLELLASLGIDKLARMKIETLSGGEKQRVGVARSLMASPAVVLADEPTGALDSDSARSVLDALVHHVRIAHAALVVVTHDKEVAGRCSRILDLSDGVLVERATL